MRRMALGSLEKEGRGSDGVEVYDFFGGRFGVLDMMMVGIFRLRDTQMLSDSDVCFMKTQSCSTY